MRSAIERDADPQQMIPKLTCLFLKTGQAEFRNSLVARDESKSSFAGPSPWQKVDVYKGQYMARNVAKDDLEAQREALSGHGYFAYSSSGSKTPWTIMSAGQPLKVISSRASGSRFEVSSQNTSSISSARNTRPYRVRRYGIGLLSTCE